MKKILSKYIRKLSIKKLSNYLINIGIVLSILNIVMIYISRSTLPEGVCPIDENNNFILLSIGVSGLGLILSFFDSDTKNKLI
ncbi:hypothetical protein E5347_13430 [Clostridium sartagoforme]|uniref:Uncharacterized protein n=1 Tax=Clostridium sartagoforme TaxID=84031 RepID=A0A4S2DGH1_9CLOT|nr:MULTISPECIES: hypothetical protein [Clostridium]MBS5939940.1 hypothetical protein [Clostridium sp.]TGY41167.1 hypothetical protein E5347_13430 [Clostridium sartagoforme]